MDNNIAPRTDVKFLIKSIILQIRSIVKYYLAIAIKIVSKIDFRIDFKPESQPACARPAD